MRIEDSDSSYNEHMLNLHEFSGTMTFETNLGLESIEFAYSLLLAPDADEDLIEDAAKSLAKFIVDEHIDKGFGTTHYSQN